MMDIEGAESPSSLPFELRAQKSIAFSPEYEDDVTFSHKK